MDTTRMPAPASITPAWEQALANRRVLRLRPEATISIKRDVHVLEVDAAPDAFAQAFHDTMRSPTSRFGLLEIRRPRDRHGAPYRLGDRFQGRFNLASLVSQSGSLWHRGLPKRVLDRIADATASDYGMLDLLHLGGEVVDGVPTWQFRYRYLEGSPIAGSSTFLVHGCARGARLTQVFEYQELNAATAAFFSVYGLRIHNQVVHAQAQQSAMALGASIVASDIPEAYVMGHDAA